MKFMKIFSLEKTCYTVFKVMYIMYVAVNVLECIDLSSAAIAIASIYHAGIMTSFIIQIVIPV